ncbi:hypothetical protein O3P69_018028 [Scylla paramamosain]|uniref:Uncharacterized protein n=1 Tax=Scylla paramamosain TaxID=85552 RepID=A0AAW0TK94_SCYPA
MSFHRPHSQSPAKTRPFVAAAVISTAAHPRTSPSGTIPAHHHPNLFPGTGLRAAHPPITSYRRRHERARLVSPIARHDLLCIKSHFGNAKSRSERITSVELLRCGQKVQEGTGRAGWISTDGKGHLLLPHFRCDKSDSSSRDPAAPRIVTARAAYPESDASAGGREADGCRECKT